MRTLIRVSGFGLLFAFAISPLLADSPPSGPSVTGPKPRAFVGVAVSPIHPLMAANLPGRPNPDQGLLVDRVAENSPAEKAGIKPNDVLLSYGDQKLFSVEQFVLLVRNDQPKHTVSVQLLRDGKPMKVELTLGETGSFPPQAGTSPLIRPMPRFGGPGPMPSPFGPEPPLGIAWQDFDSLSVKRMGENKFHVDVQYAAKEGKSRSFSFEGTPEEIRKAIEGKQELTPMERYQLLVALNLQRMADRFRPPGP